MTLFSFTQLYGLYQKLALSFVDISNYFYFNEDKYSLDEQNLIEDAVQKISQLANEMFDY